MFFMTSENNVPSSPIRAKSSCCEFAEAFEEQRRYPELFDFTHLSTNSSSTSSGTAPFVRTTPRNLPEIKVRFFLETVPQIVGADLEGVAGGRFL
jgi:hypothetical protein